MLERFLTWAAGNPRLAGAFYWSPEWFVPGEESGWGPMALFGPDGAALPAVRALAAGAPLEAVLRGPTRPRRQISTANPLRDDKE